MALHADGGSKRQLNITIWQSIRAIPAPRCCQFSVPASNGPTIPSRIAVAQPDVGAGSMAAANRFIRTAGGAGRQVRGVIVRKRPAVKGAVGAAFTLPKVVADAGAERPTVAVQIAAETSIALHVAAPFRIVAWRTLRAEQASPSCFAGTLPGLHKALLCSGPDAGTRQAAVGTPPPLLTETLLHTSGNGASPCVVRVAGGAVHLTVVPVVAQLLGTAACEAAVFLDTDASVAAVGALKFCKLVSCAFSTFRSCVPDVTEATAIVRAKAFPAAAVRGTHVHRAATV